MIGTTLAHYEVTAKVGSGGMGEVYVAEDTRLQRKVALKILPPDMAGDPERRNRFEREARAVAALNHPNIVTIYSVEQHDGIHFITMELLEGRQLSEVIPQNGLSLGRLLDMALPLTEAVSAAHIQGITHRDLKPDNIMICDDDRVKVLDFGLAKVRQEEDEDTSASSAPTRMKTGAGRVLGTASYMSPEQAEGRDVDQRSDVFSMGIVLYEMATGRHPFESETRASTVASILRDTPQPVVEINRALPRHLGRIIRLCLAKEPLRRYQSAIDLRNQLGELKRELDSGELYRDAADSVPRPGRRPRLSGMGAAVLAGSLMVSASVIAWLALSAGRTPPPPPPVIFSQLTDSPGAEMFPSLSPDGRTLAYTARPDGNWDIFVQRVGGQNPRNLTADSPVGDTHPAFSPDGNRIAFRSERDGGGIFVMGATGESIRRLTDSGYHPAWSANGRQIAFSSAGFEVPHARSSESEIWVVGAGGGEPRKLVGSDAIQPAWSPNGHRIAYWGITPGGGQRDMWTVAVDGSDPKQVTDDVDIDWNPAWSADGQHLYFSSDRGGAMNLWRIPMDEATGEVRGDPEPITTSVTASSGYMSISASGEIAYVSRIQSGNLQRVGFDPETARTVGEATYVTRGTSSVEWPDVSPDGAQLLFSSFGRQEDLFVSQPDGTGRRRLTNDMFNDRVARWSPDGAEIAFYSDRSGSYEIWAIRPDGSGLRQLTDTPGRSTGFPVWSPDGSRMIAQGLDTGEAFIFDPQVPWDQQTPAPIEPETPEGTKFAPWAWAGRGELILGNLLRPPNLLQGLATYDLRSDEFRVVLERGAYPVWLEPERSILFTNRDRILYFDLVTSDFHAVFDVGPDALPGYSLRLSPDRDALYFTRVTTEADIWFLSRRPVNDPDSDGLEMWARLAPVPEPA
jgi:serine/threonine protein kinase